MSTPSYHSNQLETMDSSNSQVEAELLQAGVNKYLESADSHFWEVPPITPDLKQLFNTDTSDDEDNESGIYNDSFILENGSVSSPLAPNSDELRLPSLDILKTPKRVDDNLMKTPKHFARGYSAGESEFDKFVPGDSSVRSTSDDLFDLQSILTDDIGKTPDHCAIPPDPSTPEHFPQAGGTLEDLIEAASPARQPVPGTHPDPPVTPSLQPTVSPDKPTTTTPAKSLEELKDILNLDNVLNAGVSEEDYQSTVVGALREYLGDSEQSDTVIDKLTTPNKQSMPINPEELRRRLNQLIADNEFKLNLFRDPDPKPSPKTTNVVFKKPAVSNARKERPIAAKPVSRNASLYQQLRSIEDSQLEYTAKLNNIKVRNEQSKELSKRLEQRSAPHSSLEQHNATYPRKSSGESNASPPKVIPRSLQNLPTSSHSPGPHEDIVIQNQYPKMKAKSSITKQQSVLGSKNKQVIARPSSSSNISKQSLPKPSSVKSSPVKASSVKSSSPSPAPAKPSSSSVQSSPAKPSSSSSVVKPSSSSPLTIKQDPNKQIVVVQPTVDGTVSKVVSTVSNVSTVRPKNSFLKLNTGAVAPGKKFVLVPVNSLNRTPQIIDNIKNISLKRSLESPVDNLVNKKPKQTLPIKGISFLDKEKISSQLEEVNPFQFTGNNSIDSMIDQANSKRKTLRNQTAFSKMQNFLDDFVQQNNEQVMEILFLKENNEQLTEKYEALQKDCAKKEIEYKRVKEDIRLMQLQNNKMQKDLDKIKTFIIAYMKNR